MYVNLIASVLDHVYFLVVLEAGNFHEKQPKGKLSPEEEVRILRRQVEVIGWLALACTFVINIRALSISSEAAVTLKWSFHELVDISGDQLTG